MAAPARPARPDRVGSLTLLAPVSGVTVPLDQVPDPVFAQRLVGDGISIDPLDDRVVAPCDARVMHVHRARHALTLSAAGLEIVIHVGLDTVGLGGDGFTAMVAAGDDVRAGDTLLTFDADLVARRARSLLTQLLVANMDQVAAMRPSSGQLRAGLDVALEITLVAASAGQGSGTPRPGAAPADEPTESAPIRIRALTGLHARPAATIVAAAKRFASDLRVTRGTQEANARSIVSIMALEVAYDDRVTVVARGPDAAAAVAALAAVIAGIEDAPAGQPAAAAAPALATAPANGTTRGAPAANDGSVTYRGVAASAGVALGHVHLLHHDDVVLVRDAADPNHERRELDAAIAAAHLQLEALRARLAGEGADDRAAIFGAHQELLEDPEVLDRAAAAILAGASAAFSWHEAFTHQAERLRALNNPLLAARATDLRDVGRRVLHLLVGHESAPPALPDDAIVIAEDLTPSEVATMDRSRVRGFCTTMGSATSHVAIIARGLGVPAVAGIDPRVLALAAGTRVLLDGDAGALTTEPGAEVESQVSARRTADEAKRGRERATATQPATTSDGQRVKVLANIGTLAEGQRVAGMGGDGVGLLRTEFLFQERRTVPSEDEQAQVYSDIVRSLGGDRLLVIRTLDVGGDKPLSYVPMGSEANPFLGERGIRLTLRHPELFRAQVRAILRASGAGPVAIMFPMIATMAEWRAGRLLVEAERAALQLAPIETGIMVETAAAALMAEHFARDADFLSVGTNDLTQYTLAMDRTNPRLAPQLDALHPAVLRLIAHTVAGARVHGRRVDVCGALAADPRAVPVLIGLGVDELSVDVPLVPAVKAQVRSLSAAACRDTARLALDAPDGDAVREIVERRHG